MSDQNSRSNTGERMRRAREQRLSQSPGSQPALNLSRPYSLYNKAAAEDIKPEKPQAKPVHAADKPARAQKSANGVDVMPIARREDPEETQLMRQVKRDEKRLEKLKKAEEREEAKRRAAEERELKKLEREEAREAEKLEREARDEERRAELEENEALRLEKKLEAADAAEEERAAKAAAKEERKAEKEAAREEKKLEREAAAERAKKLREKKREERRAWLEDETVKKRIRLFSWLGGILLFLAGAFVFIMLYAKVTQITVTGNSDYTAERVVNLSGLYTGRNLFLYDLDEAKKAVNSDPYLKCEAIRRVFPDRLDIVVSEREEFMAIRSSSGRYTIADREGFVLAVGRSDGLEGLLPVHGLDSMGFTTGTQVTSDRSALRPYTLIEIVEAIGDRSGELKYVDVSNSASLKLVTNSGVTLMLGDSADVKEKAARAMDLLDELDEERAEGAVVYVLSGGRADISYPSAPPTEEPTETEDPDAAEDPNAAAEPDATEEPDAAEEPDEGSEGGN